MSGRGGKAIKLKCPTCGKEAGHHVKVTDPETCHFGSDREAFFKRISGQDISFRIRVRECLECRKSFETFEMWSEFLSQLMAEIIRLESRIETMEQHKKNHSSRSEKWAELSREHYELKKQFESNRRKIAEIASIANDELSKI